MLSGRAARAPALCSAVQALYSSHPCRAAMAARLAVGVSCIVPRARPVVASVSQRGARRLQRNVSAPTSTWSARGVATSSPAACRGSGRVEIVLPPERDEYGRIKKKWWQRRGAWSSWRSTVPRTLSSSPAACPVLVLLPVPAATAYTRRCRRPQATDRVGYQRPLALGHTARCHIRGDSSQGARRQAPVPTPAQGGRGRLGCAGVSRLPGVLAHVLSRGCV